MGFFVQILGVTIPYQVQYRGLPFGVFIGKEELLQYDYASFIPRFSPLYTTTKEFFSRIKEFPSTIDHGPYQVHFYDGFWTPLKIGNGAYRGIQKTGYIVFKSQNMSPEVINMSFYNAPISPQSTHSAQLMIILNNKNIMKDVIIPSEKDVDISLQIPKTIVKKGYNTLNLDVSFIGTVSAQQTLYLKQMKFDKTVINLQTLDYPDPSNIGNHSSPIPYQYFGKVARDPWFLWQLRARIYEETIDFWWIKALYYWDKPKTLFITLFVLNISCVVGSGLILYTLSRKPHFS